MLRARALPNGRNSVAAAARGARAGVARAAWGTSAVGGAFFAQLVRAQSWTSTVRGSTQCRCARVGETELAGSKTLAITPQSTAAALSTLHVSSVRAVCFFARAAEATGAQLDGPAVV